MYPKRIAKINEAIDSLSETRKKAVEKVAKKTLKEGETCLATHFDYVYMFDSHGVKIYFYVYDKTESYITIFVGETTVSNLTDIKLGAESMYLIELLMLSDFYYMPHNVTSRSRMYISKKFILGSGLS